MATYTWPTGIRIQGSVLRRVRRTRRNPGPLSGRVQFQQLAGDTLGLDLRFNLSAEQRRTLQGFLAQVGPEDRIRLADPAHVGNSAAAEAVGRVIRTRGATSAGARRLAATDGWPASRTVLRLGDQLAIGGFLYLVAEATVTSSSSGVTGAVDVYPPVPASGIADNALLDLTAPPGSWLVEAETVTDGRGRRGDARLQLLQDVGV